MEVVAIAETIVEFIFVTIVLGPSFEREASLELAASFPPPKSRAKYAATLLQHLSQHPKHLHPRDL